MCENEYNNKALFQSLYSRKKRAPFRFNKKEVRERNKQIQKRFPLKPEADYPVTPDSMSDPSLPPNLTFEAFISEVSDIALRMGRSQLWDSHAISIIIFCYQMWRSTSIIDYVFSVLAYAKAQKFSILDINTIQQYIVTRDSDKENDLFEPQVGFADIRDSWKLLIKHPLFKKISFLITAAMTLPMVQMRKLTLSMAGIDLLSFEACERQHNCVDIVDAILDTFTWISETAWMVYKTGDLKYILYSDSRICRFNELYLQICQDETPALSGNLAVLAPFRNKVSEAISIIAVLQKAKVDDLISVIVERRYAHLCNIKERLDLKDKNSTMRFQPIGFSLFGPTKVGKSTLGKLTMNTSLRSMGFSTAREHQITLEPTDKYHSTMTTDVEGLFIDDLANTRSTFNKEAMTPASMVIKFFNNISAQAIKAEISEKGSVYFDFKCGVITTNKKDLDAPLYSNCPESILRRLYHVTVNVKPRYCIPGTSTLNVDHPDLVGADITHDIWLLTIQEVVVSTNPTSNSSTYQFCDISATLPGDTGPTTASNIDLKTYLRFVVFLSKQHKARQESLLNANSRFEQVKYCVHDLPFTTCGCGQLSPHFDEFIIWNTTVSYFFSWMYALFVPNISIYRLILRFLGYDNINNYIGTLLASECYSIVTDSIVPFMIKWIPEPVFNNRLVVRYFKFLTYSLVNVRCRRFYSLLKYLFYICLCLYSYGYFMGIQSLLIYGYLLLPLLILIIIFYMGHYRRVLILRERLLRSRDTLTNYSRALRDISFPRHAALLLALVGIIKGAQLIYRARYTRRPQSSSLDPEEIDKQPSWFGNLFSITKQSVAQNPATSTMVSSQAINVVKKNLYFATFSNPQNPDVGTRCCIYFPRKNVAILPRHVFYPKGDLQLSPCAILHVEVVRHPSVGGKFRFVMEYSKVVKIAPDLILVYVPNCPDIANTIKLFPKDKPTGTGWNTLVRRYSDGSINSANIYTTHTETSHSGVVFFGCTYLCDIIGSGSCISPIISKVNSSILGFHIAGRDTKGAAIYLSHDDIINGIGKLDSQFGIIISSDSTIFPESQYGKKLINEPIHPKAHVNSYTDANFLDILGQSRYGRSIKSQVQVSILSEAVTDVMGIPNTFGPPPMLPNWQHYNRVIDEVSQPGEMFPPSLLEKAMNDYLVAIYPCMKIYKEKVRPLTLKESIMGNGKRFIEPLPMNTSVGFPIFGKKEKFFTPIYDEKGNLIDRLMVDQLREEYDRILNCYKNNERAYPIFAACIKDEVKEFGSKKARIFTAVPLAFGLIIRKYFLPIIRFLHHFPKETEIAVGLNAFGLQWQDLMEYVSSYASPDDREGFENGQMGMDYKGYDTRMNCQITRAVLWILIHLAEKFGYSKDDLYIMRALVNDFSHPCVDFNGVLLQMYAMNTSGNNITVQVNCIGNSLYNRMAYFHNPDHTLPFRKRVAMTTYGDDMKCSVHENVRSTFNFITVQSFLKEYNIYVTTPDKSSIGPPFFPHEQLDFLKRQSVYIAEINRSLGRLEEKSIFKSLHCNVRSSNVSSDDVSSSCIESALHEWFAFGKDHYNRRLDQMREVCKRTNLLIPILNVSFEDRVERWKEKYLSSPSDATLFSDPLDIA